MAFWDGSRWTNDRPASSRHVSSPSTRRSRRRDWLATIPLVLLAPSLMSPLLQVGANSVSLIVDGVAVADGQIVVTGRSFPRRTWIELKWDDSADGMPTVRTTSDGQLSTTITIPAGTASGDHNLSAIIGPTAETVATVTVSVVSASVPPADYRTAGATSTSALSVPQRSVSPTTSTAPRAPATASRTPIAAPTPIATPQAMPTTAPKLIPTPPQPIATHTPAPMPRQITTPVATNIFYVAVGGSDMASGLPGSPWATLQKAADAAPSGAMIVVTAGDYAAFQLTRSGLHFSGSGAARIVGRVAIDGVSSARITNITVTNPTGHGIEIWRSSGVEISESRIVDNLMSGIREYESVSGSRLLRNVVSGNGRDGVSMNGDGILVKGINTLIEGNTIERNGDHELHEHGIYIATTASGVVVRGNSLRDNTASGIKIGGAGQVLGNIISGSRAGIVYADAGGAVSVTGNDVDATGYSLLETSTAVLARFASDYNAFRRDAFLKQGAGTLTLVGWQIATGLDLNSN